LAGFTALSQTSPYPSRFNHVTFSYNNKLYLVGGTWASLAFPATILNEVQYNDVWSSTDGANWSAVTLNAAFGARECHEGVIFNNQMWIIGGQGSAVTNGGDMPYSDAWYSTDGANWTQAVTGIGFANFAAAQGAAVSFGGKIWLFGTDNHAYSSPNGITWTKSTGTMPFPQNRIFFGAAVLNGNIFLFGGGTGSAQVFNDCWYSPDGVTWTPATAAAGFSARQGFAYTSFNSQIWLMGGVGLGPFPEDAWFTENGVAWNQGAGAIGWTAETSCAVLNNKIYVTGGNTGGNSVNNVWVSH
jgi:hypothetical protein